MKKMTYIKRLSVAVCVLFSQTIFAQLPDGFDIKKAQQDAVNKGISASDIDGYVQFLHNDYLTHKNHSHGQTTSSTNQGGVYNMGTIYKNFNNNNSVFRSANPNTTQNIYCPNAGFEQATFTNWTGGYGTVSTGATTAAFPSYTQTSPTIVNPAGNNVGLTNTANYHTVMTTPATNSVYPNCVGYDSIACKVVGTQTVSEIPVVNPTGGPASVRLNGAIANYRASKLNYNMVLNPNNKSFSVSYALVLENGGHNAYEQPYFAVKVTDQNGNPVPGCSVYTVTCNSSLTNTASPLYDPSWTNGVIGFGRMYRKWQTFAFDFTNYPTVTSVNVEFYVGGCSQAGHFGYAYVDAECSLGGAVSSFCAGSSTTILNAPIGFSTYQWIGPLGPITAANGGSTRSATITPVTAGQVFTCNVTAPNGCISAFQTTVSITTVGITGVNSTPSCPNGLSGTAIVAATGSSNGYNYQWFNSIGASVGSSQTATGLSPGTYSVAVSSPSCGMATTTVNVGVSAPNYYSLSAPFCGAVAWISKPGGSGYRWYTTSPVALIPGNTTASLTVMSPTNGAQYFLAYTTASGCRDSIRYTLSQQPGGSVYTNNIKSICVGNSNSYAVINLQTNAPPVYSYSVTGPSGYYSTLLNTTSKKDSITGLSIGTYSATIFDGQCLYNTTFTVNPYIYSYTLTPSTSTICATSSTSLSVNFGNIVPSTCGLSGTGACTSSNFITKGTGTSVNSSTGYPAIYGNFYRNTRHQILYTAAELLSAGVIPGKISSIAWNVTAINGISTYPDFTIKMKCTSVSNLSTLPFDNVGLTQVYYSPSVNITTGWNTYQFPVPYEWDGVSNLLIDVCNSITPITTAYPSGWSSNSSSPYTITPFTSVRYYNNDVTLACPVTNANSTSPNRPNIIFENCGASNPNAFTYTWTPTTGLSSSTTYTSIASPTVTTVYTVQVNPIGQTNCVNAQTSTVTILNPVTPTITSTGPLCSNATTVNLVATPVGGVWVGSGVTSSGVLTPSNTTIGNNTYTYSIGTGLCASVANTTVSIEAYVPSTIVGSVGPLCVTGSTLDLSSALSTSTIGVGTWSGSGVTGTTFNPLTAGTGTHTLTYNTNSVPTVTLCPSTSTISVIINSVTQPTISAAGPFCDNYAVQQLTVSPMGGIWTPANVGTNVSGTGVFSPGSSLIGSNKMYYTLTNAPCIIVDSITVDVVKFVPATIIGALGPYCIYDAAPNLQSIAQFPGGVWSGNGVTGTTFSPSIAGAGVSILTYSTDPMPSGLCPDSKTVSIVVNAKPDANAVPNINVGCNPVSVDYSTTTVNTGTAIWDFGDGTPLDTGLFINHVYTVPGTYTATLYYTDNIGCKDTTTASSGITVNAIPVASFAPSILETTVVDGQVDFTNQSTVLGNNTYSWDIGGLYTSSQVDETYLFTNSGDYVVTLIATSSEGCVDDTSVVIKINPDVVLYVPNAFTPGKDGLNDVFQIFLPPTGVDYSTFKLSVYDRWGELMYQSNDVNVCWNGAKNNSGEVLKQDTYIWKISFKDERKKLYQKSGHITLLHK